MNGLSLPSFIDGSILELMKDGHKVMHLVKIRDSDIVLEFSHNEVYRHPDYYTYTDTQKYEKRRISKTGEYEVLIEITLDDKNKARYEKEYEGVIQSISSVRQKLLNDKLPEKEKRRNEAVLADLQYRFCTLYDILET